MNNIKNVKGAGRKRNFSTQELLGIVDSYIFEGDCGVLNASQIAKYAKEKVNSNRYKNIRYSHFTTDDVVSKRIEELQENGKQKFADDGVLAFQNIDINAFVDKNIKNPFTLKKSLNDVQIGQESMYKRLVKLDAENKSLKTQLKDKSVDVAKENAKEFKNVNKELKETIKMLHSLVDVDNHMKMCQFIWDNSLIEAKNLVDQYITILFKCGVIRDSDVENMKQSSDFVYAEENEDDDGDNVIEFEKIYNKEMDEEVEMDVKTKDKNVSVDELKDLLGYDDDK